MRASIVRILFTAVPLSLITGCKNAPPEPPPPYVSTIQLTLEDTGVTEAWLKLKFTDASLPRTFSLQREGHATLSGTLVGQDTVLVDTGMAPRVSYSYKAFRLIGTTRIDSSAPLQIITMDTTNHSITWALDTLGVAFSILNDIAIVNDTLAFAVGEIYLRDSTGQLDPRLYNLAVWNGDTWSIRRVPYYYGGIPYYYPIEGVFAFGSNDVWLCGGGLSHWDGNTYTEVPIPSSVWGQSLMKRIWGISSSQIYVVGTNGSAAYFDGGTWQQIQTGTTLDFYDIWGSRNRNGQWEILALASIFSSQTQESAIVEMVGNSATPVDVTGLSADMGAIWSVPGKVYYAVGAGIHRKRSLSDSAWVVYPPGVVTSNVSWGVRGVDINDVFVMGSFGEVVHFNGVNWHSYFPPHYLPTGGLGPVAVTKHLVIAVGDIGGNRGAALIGRR